MNTSQTPIVIVGAGHSGAKAAAALRKHGWDGGITLIGDEICPPYDRPPLSKDTLQNPSRRVHPTANPTTPQHRAQDAANAAQSLCSAPQTARRPMERRS